jgi:DNA-binding Lrp family transcriptional regulator
MTLSPISNIRWTPEEDQRLLDLVAAEATWPLIAFNLRRSMQAVQERVQTLKRDGVVTGPKAKGK